MYKVSAIYTGIGGKISVIIHFGFWMHFRQIGLSMQELDDDPQTLEIWIYHVNLIDRIQAKKINLYKKNVFPFDIIHLL